MSQSAEFSFLLASLGAGLGVVSQGVFGLMLAGSALSVIVSPQFYRSSRPLAVAADRRFPSHSPPPTSPEAAAADDEQTEVPLRGHAIVCGYGQVGQLIVALLRRRRFAVVVVEEDIRKVRHLRARGIEAVLGNAGNPAVLEHLGFERARVLVVAVPDQLAARQAIGYAQRVNPRLDIVVRTHSREERRFLRRREVDEVVLGEVEIALEMARHTLRRFGVSMTEVQATVQRLRERLAEDETEFDEDLPISEGAERRATAPWLDSLARRLPIVRAIAARIAKHSVDE
jgi:CPA2 family monovalent cation:H+ antiporter-2